MTITILDNMEYGSNDSARSTYFSDAIRPYPYSADSNTSVLLLMDGENNSTTFTDSSNTPKTFTAYGHAKISTSIYAYGGSAGFFDGNGDDYVSTPYSNDFNFGSGDFTVECAIYNTGFNDYNSVCMQGTISGNRGWNVSLVSNTQLKFYYTTNGSTDKGFTVNYTFVANRWYHIAVTRSGSSIYFFVNGVLINSGGTSFTETIYAPSQPFVVGRFGDYTASTHAMKGYIDGLRVKKGIAEWTSSFPPPTLSNTSILDAYSESSNIVEGSYSLKAIAAQTTSLNKTLTRTISSPINLTGHAYIIGKIRSNRTGSNIKIGFHDSGGTTTEVTPNITAADTWQTIQLDISGVSDANKDAIDQIIITVVNADADNTFYLDNFFASDSTDFGAGTQVSKAVGYAVLTPIEAALNVSKVVGYAVLIPVSESSDSGPMIWIF